MSQNVFLFAAIDDGMIEKKFPGSSLSRGNAQQGNVKMSVVIDFCNMTQTM